MTTRRATAPHRYDFTPYRVRDAYPRTPWGWTAIQLGIIAFSLVGIILSLAGMGTP